MLNQGKLCVYDDRFTLENESIIALMTKNTKLNVVIYRFAFTEEQQVSCSQEKNVFTSQKL